MLDFGNKVNAITPIDITKLGLRFKPINVGVQKIDSSTLEIHVITLTSFLLQDSQRRVQLFEETFLLAIASMEIVLEMPFLALSNIDVKFIELEKLI